MYKYTINYWDRNIFQGEKRKYDDICKRSDSYNASHHAHRMMVHNVLYGKHDENLFLYNTAEMNTKTMVCSNHVHINNGWLHAGWEFVILKWSVRINKTSIHITRK